MENDIFLDGLQVVDIRDNYYNSPIFQGITLEDKNKISFNGAILENGRLASGMVSKAEIAKMFVEFQRMIKDKGELAVASTSEDADTREAAAILIEFLQEQKK